MQFITKKQIQIHSKNLYQLILTHILGRVPDLLIIGVKEKSGKTHNGGSKIFSLVYSKTIIFFGSHLLCQT